MAESDTPGGMNVFVYNLAREKISSEPDHRANEVKIEDNVGESIHLHYRNIRIEMTVDEFLVFANELSAAAGELENYGA